MARQPKWSFVVEGAEKRQGGSYSGERIGFFRVWYVTGGDGVKFQRSPYVVGGWTVQKRRLSFDGIPIEFVVKNTDDLNALNAFVGVEPYSGYGAKVCDE